ncbi:hypothetical protein [Bradyrhizobium liaoningense]|uniref:hypothetical protein n=1 Tax=Bradyrhizobium liaoningense TaxID=43992 RepID=UPI001BA48720|nr:hypothetical protein [Bradyrhizobium liaoningense]MBR1170705.1 hypothetical protein [Bradyrhizobium liaoningense]
MTREKQIRAAMKELGGRGRDEVVQALDNIAEKRALRERRLLRTTMETRKALSKIASAMHRAKQGLNKLPPEIRDELGLPDVDQYKTASIKILREKRGRSGDELKMIAAREAQRLLTHFELPISTYRLGPWDRLSAILYGDPKQYFSVQFKKIRREKKNAQGSKLSFPAF